MFHKNHWYRQCWFHRHNRALLSCDKENMHWRFLSSGVWDCGHCYQLFRGEFFRTTMTREAVYYCDRFVHIYSNVDNFVSQKTGNYIFITVWTSGLMTCILLKIFISIYTKKNGSSDKDMIIFIFKLQTKSWDCVWCQTSVMVINYQLDALIIIYS